MLSTLVTPGGDTYPFLATELVSDAMPLDRALEAGISADALRKAWKHGREALDDIHSLGCVCVSQPSNRYFIYSCFGRYFWHLIHYARISS
jgi:hypothetical protein